MGLINKGQLDYYFEYSDRTEESLILKLSLEGTILFSSKNSNAIIGYEPIELIGTHLKILMHQEDSTQIKDHFPTGSQEVSSASLRLLNKAGDTIPCNITFTLVSHENSSDYKEIICCIQDSSSKSHIDTGTIDNEKLKVAGQLAAGIAHEIKNPLTSIKGFIQLMKAEPVLNKKYLEIVEDEIKRLELISNELLVLTKPQAHDIKLHDLSSLVNEVVFLMEAEALQKSIQFHLISNGGPLMSLCDRNKVKQVLINIVKNGIEAMDQPGVITILLSSNGFDAQIAITDEGYGIPEQYMKKLGEPFFSTKKTGNGLGLMVCQKIISEHNGKIAVESKPNDGTTFTIELPLVK